MKKVDVCLNFYGKPYQTIVTLSSLWEHSKKHIDRIFIIVERQQPHNHYNGVYILKHYLKDMPITYFTPKYFYDGVGSPPVEWLQDPEKRYGLNFQYALEKSDKNLMFITHNDCLYKEDLLGKMLARLKAEKTVEKVAGIGLIGQCWNCPAFEAQVCDSNRFHEYQPDSHQLTNLIEKFPPVRRAIHEQLIDNGYLHPLPECRLNEYACLINVPYYNKEVYPGSNVRPFGGSWHGTDTGAVWFYEMYNLGYKFINFPFEPAMIHAPFADNGSGHKGNSNQSLYQRTEAAAREYLISKRTVRETEAMVIKLHAARLAVYIPLRRMAGKVKHKVKQLF